MAETKEKKPARAAAPAQQAKPQAKQEKNRPAGEIDAAPKAREGMPRLRAYYSKPCRPKLARDFGLTNPHQVRRRGRQ